MSNLQFVIKHSEKYAEGVSALLAHEYRRRRVANQNRRAIDAYLNAKEWAHKRFE